MPAENNNGLRIEKNCCSAKIVHRCRLDCPPSCEKSSIEDEIDWWLPESTLALLWDDVFQRIIIYNWCFLEDREHANEAGYSKLICKPVRRRARRIRNNGTVDAFFNIDEDGYPNPPFHAESGEAGQWYIWVMMKIMKADKNLSQNFRKHLDDLLKYFRPGRFDKIIPVFLLRANGYDYLLSSDGIELPLPDRPAIKQDDFRDEVYRLYRDRITSRNLLAVPPNRCGPKPAPYDCSTARESEVKQLRTVRMVETDNNIEQIRFGLPTMLKRLAREDVKFTYHLEGEELENIAFDKLLKAIMNKILPCPDEDDVFDFDCDLALRRLIKENKKRIKKAEEPDDEPSLELALMALFCLLIGSPLDECTYRHFRGSARCWQLSGSVFRRIANEMPRIKAEIWLDQLLNTKVGKDIDESIEEICPQPDATDRARERRKESIGRVRGRVERRVRRLEDRYYNNLSEESAREIFQERLETTLPSHEYMYFRGLHTAEPPFYDEIIIHNCGFTLPRVCDGPDKDFVYRTWKNGIAGNPVFTDSSPTS